MFRLLSLFGQPGPKKTRCQNEATGFLVKGKKEWQADRDDPRRARRKTTEEKKKKTGTKEIEKKKKKKKEEYAKPNLRWENSENQKNAS